MNMRRVVIAAIMLILAASGMAGAARGGEEMAVFGKGARILFQGDSITDGNRGRNEDPNHILGHGYAFIIAARFGSEFPERRLVFMNRGISGNTVQDLGARWKSDTLDLRPDVLSIMVGINDVDHVVGGRDASTVEQFEQRYDHLLSETVAAYPKVRLVLCEPFALRVGRVVKDWDRWQAEVGKRRAVVDKLAAKYHAPVVHLQRVFDEACERAPADYWIWDGIHPTYSGHQLIADEWVRTVRQFWRDDTEKK